MSEPDKPAPESPDPNDFHPGDEVVDPRLELRSAFSETLTTHGFPDTLVLSRGRADVLFHDRRIEILDHLKENEPESVRALAKELGYDKGVISRDLTELASIGVIEYVRDGKAKVPRLKHRHVVVEPVV